MPLQFKKKYVFTILGSLLLLLLSFKLGSYKTTWNDIYLWLQGKSSIELATLLGKVRLPRTLASFFVGGTLAFCGTVLQSILRNPLADSYTLGISGGSAVGASLVLLLGFSPLLLWVPVFSNLGAILVLFFVIALSQKSIHSQSRTLILVGLMLSLFFGAFSVFLVSLLPADKNQAALAWLMGEFGSSRDLWVYYFSPLCFLLILAVIQKSKVLDALSLGEAKTMSLGFNTKKEKTFLIAVCTVLTSLAITISGLVGFIGLVSPHISRKFLKTSQHIHILAMSFFVGGCLLLSADTIGRIILSDREIPAGSLSALIGAPVLIYLLIGKANAQTE